MKRIASVLLILVLLIPCVAFAAVPLLGMPHEEPILFRGIKWGATREEAAKALPAGLVMTETKTSEYWYSTSNMMFDESFNDYYKGELGCYEYTRSSNAVQVAGYEVKDIYLYYAYHTGEDGLLIKDDEHTSLLYAYYKIEPKDPAAAYNDLIGKLTSLYGDVDFRQRSDSVITYTQNLWYGADGTMVSLVKADYSTGSHYIYIKYGFSGADDLLNAAYDAVVLEERLNAASNVDGL